MAKIDKMPADVRRWPDDNKPMIVVRPKNPQVTVMLAEIAVRHQNEEAMRQAAQDDVTFVGFLVRRGGKFLAVDENGENPTEMIAGDMIISPDEIQLPD